MTENQLNVANSVSFSSDYYINKNISEIVMNYIKTSDHNNIKTIKSVATGVGIIIVAEIAKSVILDFLKEQKKQMNEGLLNMLKEVSIFPTLIWTIKLPFRTLGFSYNLLLNKYNNIFYSRFEEKSKIIDNSMCFEIETSQMFISNLVKYVETNEETCKYNKIYDNKITVEKNNIDSIIKYNNIDINFEDINITINKDIIKSRDKCEIENITYDNIFEKIVEEYLLRNIKISLNDTDIYISGYTNDFSCINIMIYNYLYSYRNLENEDTISLGDYIFTLCIKKYKTVLMELINANKLKLLNQKIKSVLLISVYITCEFVSINSYNEKIDIIKKMYNNDKKKNY